MNKNNFKCQMSMLRALWKITQKCFNFSSPLKKRDKMEKMNFKM